MTESKEKPFCVVCNNLEISLNTDFSKLSRITSDCRPFNDGGNIYCCSQCGCVQKVPDETWLKEISEIYAQYNSYSVGGGNEQMVFVAGKDSPVPRSDVVFEKIKSIFGSSKFSTLLDIGCGNGVSLKSALSFFVEIELYGHELGVTDTSSLFEIPEFKEIFTAELSEIDRKFDLITMFHSLEHFDNPFKALTDIHKLLSNSGYLFIEIPNFDANPFDILIADHLTHFTPNSLAQILEKSGFIVEYLHTDWVHKEISVLAKVGTSNAVQSENNIDVPSQTEKLNENVLWLNRLIKDAIKLRKENEIFCCFGTSIASSWIAFNLEDQNFRVDLFLDEDPNRIGNSLIGVDIIHPLNAPQGASVFIPLAPAIGRNIRQKLIRQRPDLNVICA